MKKIGGVPCNMEIYKSLNIDNICIIDMKKITTKIKKDVKSKPKIKKDVKSKIKTDEKPKIKTDEKTKV